MDELFYLSAAEAADLVGSGQASSRELTEAVLARIEAANPELNAVVELRAEAALEEAAKADAAPRDGARGPLHGVPITIKDAFNVAGLHTTWGNPAFANYVADRDATVVSRLRDAGAIVVGKTNVAEMLADFGQTANNLYGVTNNPWDVTRTPGGSSGGAAAAVAAGLSFLDYGSDVVGSIRIPASFCGTYGLKPSAGIVPLTGFSPPGAPASPAETTYMCAAGPIGRSPSDLRLALVATAGPEAPAARAYSWRLARPRHTRLADFRVGAVFDDEHVPVSSEITTVLAQTVSELAGAGVTVIEGWPDGIDPWQVSEAFNFHVGLFFAFQQPDQEFAGSPGIIAQQARRLSVRAAWQRYFEDIDVLLCPANFTPAFAHDQRPFDQRTIATPAGQRRYAEQPFWIAHASLPGLPALAIPVGRTPLGLPVGAQVIGPLYEDDTALTFAELLAGHVGGYRQPPT